MGCQFRFAVHAGWSCVPELLTLGVITHQKRKAYMKPMHKLVILASLTLAVGIVTYAADKSAPTNTKEITASINFKNVDVDTVLATYKSSVKAELVVASDVRPIHGITLQATGVSLEVEQHLIEQALLKQAGIVLTRLDDGRVSVTYNDKLELQP
jgi:hypothetical protein